MNGGHQIPQAVAPMLRWSSARDCGRKAIYEATAAPHRDRTHREERVLARGRSVGHDYIVAIANESRRTVHVCSGTDYMLPYPDLRATDEEHAGILAELPVAWELGVGHADAFIPDAETVIEVVSSQRPSGDLIHSKLLQAAGYARAQQLAAFVPEGAWQVGGYRVRRSERAGRRSFDFARADPLDGRFPDGLIAEFTKVGEPFVVWDVEKTGAVVTVDDEEAPF